MAYWEWIQQTRCDLRNLSCPEIDQSGLNFFQSYRNHVPVVVNLPNWPAFHWTIPELRERVGRQTVQVQIDRCDDPDYELYPDRHRGSMSFAKFCDLVETSPPNGIYITAQNSIEHRNFTSILATDIRPMPSYLTDQPESAFLWIGKNTLTPLHHDITHNIMCQIMGRKHVRIVAPEHWQQVRHRQGVHTHIGWLSDEIAKARNIPFRDFWIDPGDGLLLPVGHFHCVEASGLSITAVFTNFIWPNDAYKSFQPIGELK